MNINYVVEVKNNGKYEQTNICNDRTQVYESLSNDLISKKLCNCTYIKSIKRIQLYNGYVKIVVSYDNDVRRTYTIESH